MLMLSIPNTLVAQSVVVLDNSLTACNYSVAMKWGDLSNCDQYGYTCGEPSTTTIHGVNAYQSINVPVPMGYNGPCRVQVTVQGGGIVGNGSCHKPNHQDDFDDCNTDQVFLDFTYAWTVKWS